MQQQLNHQIFNMVKFIFFRWIRSSIHLADCIRVILEENATGALASILVGVSSYMCIHLFYPNPFGIHTVVFPICFAFIAYILGSMVAVKKTV